MNTSIKDIVLKDGSDVKEALNVLVQADEVIKVLAKNRKAEPVLNDELLSNKIDRISLKRIGASGSMMLSGFPFAFMDFGAAPIIGAMLLGGAGFFYSMTRGTLAVEYLSAGDTSRAQKHFSRTYQKVAQELEVEQRLFALTEKEYKKKEKKLLKRIQPALDVVNASLDGDKLFYSSSHGDEGIKLLKKAKPDLTQWDYVGSQIEAVSKSQKSLEMATPEQKSIMCACDLH